VGHSSYNLRKNVIGKEEQIKSPRKYELFSMEEDEDFDNDFQITSKQIKL